MNKQNNQLTLSVIATLIAGIALIYTLIMFPQIIFAVAGISLVFLIAATILTQNIISFITRRERIRNSQIQNCIDDISSQIETMGMTQSRLAKATFLYTRQTSQTLSLLENNYAESQEALYKNLMALSNAQNKSTKLMIKYDQSNTTKVISTLKELRNQLSDTMIQGFDQIQPNNNEVVEVLEDIVVYLKSQSTNIDQSMSSQLNNVARELQNISNSIQQVQVSIPNIAQAATPVMQQPVSVAPVPETPVEDLLNPSVPEVSSTEEIPVENVVEEAIEETPEVTETATENIEETPKITETATEDTNETETIPEDTSKDITKSHAEEPEADMTPAAEEDTPEEEKPFTPTFKVVGKEDPVEDDPNKQLSADEIAALFAAADPAPKKPETAKEEPVMDDPNKQLSPDEIAALFAAAEPSPKKEEAVKAPEPIKVEPISDDPNKQLSPDEIAALFASLG